MFQIPSWKWLSTPFTRRPEPSAPRAQKAAVRPCLPIIEQLDDRVLLDATAPAVTTASEVGGPTLLIGLLNKAATLSASEFAALDGIKGESTDDKHKDWVLSLQLGDDFNKLDGILANFGNDVLGGVTSDKGGKVLLQIQDTFLKIDKIATDLGTGPDGELLPAVQKIHDVENAALLGDGSVFKLITQLPGNLGGISTDDLQKVMKISNSLLKIDGIVIQDQVNPGMGNVAPPEANRLGDEFLKLDGLIGSINDPGLKLALQNFEISFVGGIPGQGGTGFTGGVSVTGGTLT